MNHAFLALACLALLGVIAAQDYLYAPLRNETISAGLTGPYHWWLDASYLVLAVALVGSFTARPPMEVFAALSAVFLVAVGATNTLWRTFDAITDGKHALWHSRFTIAVFASALLLQVAGDEGWRWGLTALNVLVPAGIYGWFHYRATLIEGVSVAASPAAEKAFVLGLCVWLIVWTL